MTFFTTQPKHKALLQRVTLTFEGALAVPLAFGLPCTFCNSFHLLPPLFLPLWVVPLLSFHLPPQSVSSPLRTAYVAERPSVTRIAIVGQKPRPRCTWIPRIASLLVHQVGFVQALISTTFFINKKGPRVSGVGVHPTNHGGSSQTLLPSRFPRHLPLPSHPALRLDTVAKWRKSRPNLGTRSHLQLESSLLPRPLCPKMPLLLALDRG